jgi:hypothetical protein
LEHRDLGVFERTATVETCLGEGNIVYAHKAITNMARQLRRNLKDLRERFGQHGAPPPSIHKHLSLEHKEVQALTSLYPLKNAPDVDFSYTDFPRQQSASTDCR